MDQKGLQVAVPEAGIATHAGEALSLSFASLALRSVELRPVAAPPPVARTFKSSRRPQDSKDHRPRQLPSAVAEVGHELFQQQHRRRKAITAARALSALGHGIVGLTILKLPSLLRVARPVACAIGRKLPLLVPGRLRGSPSIRSGFLGGNKNGILWLRSDLRVHDNPALAKATKECMAVLPVYCFDPREYGKSSSGFDKTGPHRAKFIIESLLDLRRKFQELNSDVYVCIGKPAEVLGRLVRQVKASAVYCHGEDDIQVEGEVQRVVEDAGAQMKFLWGGTLYDKSDLPFELESMPPNFSFGEFRKVVESISVKPAVEIPAQLRGLPKTSLEFGPVPGLRELGFSPLAEGGNRADGLLQRMRGGETQAFRQLQHFFKDMQQRAVAANARSRDKESAFQSNITPWLALGCLSPREIFHQVQQHLPKAKETQPNKEGSMAGTSGTWMFFELLWRDYHRLIRAKHAAACTRRQVSYA